MCDEDYGVLSGKLGVIAVYLCVSSDAILHLKVEENGVFWWVS